MDNTITDANVDLCHKYNPIAGGRLSSLHNNDAY